MVNELIILFLLFLLNGLFSMSEMAIVSSKKSRLKREADSGNERARAALSLADNPTSFLSTVQVGITLVGIAAGVYGGATLANSASALIVKIPPLAPYSGMLGYGLVIFGITYFSLVLGELLPKRLALSWPETIAKGIGPLIGRISKFFSPFVRILEFSTELLVRLLPVSMPEQSHVTEDDIQSLIAEGRSSGLIENTEEKIVGKVFRLGDRPARSLMTPRGELVWLDLDQPVESVWRTISDEPHHYYPVTGQPTGEPLGIIAFSDLAIYVAKAEEGRGPLSDLIRSPLMVPSTATALQVLEGMKGSKKRVALVIDEYGGTDGMVTTHDILEAMVGELQGEDEDPDFTKRPDGSILVDGMMEIRELLALLGFPTFDEEEHQGYYSVAGFVMARLGHVPVPGERCSFDGFDFEVLDMDRHRIDKILVSPQRDTEESVEAPA